MHLTSTSTDQILSPEAPSCPPLLEPIDTDQCVGPENKISRGNVGAVDFEAATLVVIRTLEKNNSTFSASSSDSYSLTKVLFC